MSGEAISRRNFLKTSAFCAGGILIFNYCGNRSSLWQSFSMHEGLTVEAISEQIIPSDQDAGGKAAGVAFFIDKQLQGPYRRYHETYLKGLAAIDASAKEMFGKKFINLTFNDQTKMLEDMEKGELPKERWANLSQRDFFRLLRSHSLQGFYGDPQHGGNREYVSYKMLDLKVLMY